MSEKRYFNYSPNLYFHAITTHLKTCRPHTCSVDFTLWNKMYYPLKYSRYNLKKTQQGLAT